MVRVFAILATLAGALLVGASAAPIEAAPRAQAAGTESIEMSAQRRARPHIRVTPRYPRRHFHTAYPLPYRYEHPGPGAVRECRARYVQEHRPSGTVIVPRMTCWWAGG